MYLVFKFFFHILIVIIVICRSPTMHAVMCKSCAGQVLVLYMYYYKTACTKHARACRTYMQVDQLHVSVMCRSCKYIATYHAAAYRWCPHHMNSRSEWFTNDI